MTFSDSLKAVLNERNIKQAELCRITGISSALMSNYATGTVEPSLNNAIAIADALNLGLDELLIYADKTKAPGYDPTLEELKGKFNYLIQFVPEHMRQPLIDMVEASAVNPEPPQ